MLIKKLNPHRNFFDNIFSLKFNTDTFYLTELDIHIQSEFTPTHVQYLKRSIALKYTHRQRSSESKGQCCISRCTAVKQPVPGQCEHMPLKTSHRLIDLLLRM